MPATIEDFRCMMCGHDYQEKVEQGEDKERGAWVSVGIHY